MIDNAPSENIAIRLLVGLDAHVNLIRQLLADAVATTPDDAIDSDSIDASAGTAYRRELHEQCTS